MDYLILKITCDAFTQVELDSIADLQGSLKELSEKEEVKLRNSLIKYGFSFPIFFWEDSAGQKWSIDSQQRRTVLKKMRDEGWTIPPLPADPIHAKSKTEAKEKLLLLNSRYGKITDSGFDAFIGADDSKIDLDGVVDFLTLPEIIFGEQPPKKDKTKLKPMITCPKCGVPFRPE